MNETSSKYISQAERLAIKINHLVAKFEQDNDTDTLDRLKPMLQHWKLIHGESRRSIGNPNWLHVIKCIEQADYARGERQLLSTPQKADARPTSPVADDNDPIDWILRRRDMHADRTHDALHQAESFLTMLHTQT